MYTVQGKSFKDFYDMVEWVWNTHKISFEGSPDEVDLISEEDKQQACRDLDEILALGNECPTDAAGTALLPNHTH